MRAIARHLMLRGRKLSPPGRSEGPIFASTRDQRAEDVESTISRTLDCAMRYPRPRLVPATQLATLTV
jgi:hypothetical protein